MSERKALLKESISKLLSLNVSDQEIVLNLKDVGLSGEEAKSILEETKQDFVPPKKASKKEEEGVVEEEVDTSSELEPGEEEPKKKKEKEIEDELFSFPKEKKAKEKSMEETTEEEVMLKTTEGGVLELWEKGIMATINSRLSEMQKLKNDTEKILEEKTQKAFEKEAVKIEAVFKSQRNLGAASIKSALEKKSKEVEETIDLKISQLNKISDSNEGLLKKLEQQKSENTQALGEMNQKIQEFTELKTNFVTEMDAEVSAAKTKVNKFLGDAEAKRKDTIERINRSLELESKIIDGLISDAKQKVDALAAEKGEQIEKYLSNRFAKQKKELEVKTRVLEDFESKIDVETIVNTMDELEAYKEQFVAQVKKNVASFNSAKKELTELIRQRESLIDKQLEILKLKIREFDAFEKQFAEQMGLKIDKIAQKKGTQVSKNE